MKPVTTERLVGNFRFERVERRFRTDDMRTVKFYVVDPPAGTTPDKWFACGVHIQPSAKYLWTTGIEQLTPEQISALGIAVFMALEWYGKETKDEALVASHRQAIEQLHASQERGL